MCGIAGTLNLTDHPPVTEDALLQMLGMLRHRGPDGAGIYRDAHVGFGNTRLSIIDLEGGQQPISNEDGTIWLVCNGEIFNYVELRPELEARGHHFATQTDVEVIIHLYEDHGPACLDRLNGQFAIALWDSRERRLFLARDRMGIRPLFYTVKDGQLLFGSEIKALLAYPGMSTSIDPDALNQVFTFWSTLSPRTVFRDIVELPAGHYLESHDGEIAVNRYWQLEFAEKGTAWRSTEEYLDEFESLLTDSVRIRLRADVPVGAYLSGGLDSSVTTSMVRDVARDRLQTFSIGFDDAEFDESRYQRQMVDFLDTDHHTVSCADADIGRTFPDVVWHTETPILRTAPIPMYLLSGLVNRNRFKVVLTGEGADEILAGYNVFKEMAVRRFWAKRPDSPMRASLLSRLYPYISNLHAGTGAYLTTFFRKGLSDTSSPFYSHAIRWSNSARCRRFLAHKPAGLYSWSDEFQKQIPLPDDFSKWTHLGQAQYLEMRIFLSQYLLSSQGDRMAMAHSVEGRFPFLDHRVVEFCNTLPPRLKLRGLDEKWLLKQLGRKRVPAAIWQRAKQPYRAPIRHSVLHSDASDVMREMLSEEALQETGLFVPGAVAQLVRKADSQAPFSETEEMALAGILSTQLVHEQFVKTLRRPPAPIEQPKIVDRVNQPQVAHV